MRVRKWTSSGDYSFGNGQADFYRDVPEAVQQTCVSRLRLWIGEWFLDTEDGTPWPIGVLGKKSQTVADDTIQKRMLGTQALTAIDSYDSVIDPATRKMSVTTTIDTLYGPSRVQVQNYANY